MDCRDCRTITADNDTTGFRAAAVRLCPTHKRQQADNLAVARAANPEVDAVHRMIAAMQGR